MTGVEAKVASQSSPSSRASFYTRISVTGLWLDIHPGFRVLKFDHKYNRLIRTRSGLDAVFL
jgi:hypothetical protein